MQFDFSDLFGIVPSRFKHGLTDGNSSFLLWLSDILWGVRVCCPFVHRRTSVPLHSSLPSVTLP